MIGAAWLTSSAMITARCDDEVDIGGSLQEYRARAGSVVPDSFMAEKLTGWDATTRAIAVR
jgi:hypothetical protein